MPSDLLVILQCLEKVYVVVHLHTPCFARTVIRGSRASVFRPHHNADDIIESHLDCDSRYLQWNIFD